MPQLGRRRRPLHDRCVTPRDPRVTPCDPRMTRLDSDHSLSSSGSDLGAGPALDTLSLPLRRRSRRRFRPNLTRTQRLDIASGFYPFSSSLPCVH